MTGPQALASVEMRARRLATALEINGGDIDEVGHDDDQDLSR
jgi:hypothetical protein